MRLIDGDELMKSVLCITMTADGRIPLNTMLDRIQKAPEVTGWVSVEDRLPEATGRYLCWFGKNVCFKGVKILVYVNELEAFLSPITMDRYPNVTHWMPLHEPPEEENDETD